MKKIFIAAALFSTVILFAAHAAPFRMQKRLVLPETIYAVPGIECNIYFRNIFTTVNPANFAFYAKCVKGRCDEKRWYFTPKSTDVGTYDIEVEVYDDDGMVAEKKLKLVVVPADAGKGRKISLLIIGASDISMYHAFPKHIYNLFQLPGNPELTMLGENGPGLKSKKLGNVRHEGYGGWSYSEFTGPGRRPNVKKLDAYNMRGNPFWNKETKSLDFPAYFKKHNKGKAPDFIFVSLSNNAVLNAEGAEAERRLERIRKQMITFITVLRKAAPQSVILLAKKEISSSSQDAFGNNYGCKVFRYRAKRNCLKVWQLIDSFVAAAKDPLLIKTELFHALDTENNVPQRREIANARNHTTRVMRQANGLHPTPNGYQQIADAAYGVIKFQLSKQKK